MSFIYDFSDNVSVSAENLNSIASGIGEGTVVSQNFADNTSYAINKLNSIRSDILNPGVVSGMECSYADGAITISPGVAFFKNGMRLEITDDESFSAVSGGVTYVYLYASESFNCALPLITASPKESDAYIPVAVVDEYGNVSDARSFSTSKIPLSSGAAVQKINISYDVENTSVVSVSPNKKTHTINLKDKYFNYVIFNVTIGASSSKKEIRGYYKRSSGRCCGVYYDGYSWNADFDDGYIGRYDINAGTYVKPVFENGVFKVQTDSTSIAGKFNMSLEVI